MKNYFTKMMALACMFLLVGANAKGETVWQPTSSDGAGTTFAYNQNQWQTISPTPVQFMTSEAKPYDYTVKGIKFAYGKDVKFKTENTDGGIATFTFEANQDNAYVGIRKNNKNGELLAFCYAPIRNNYSYGTGSSFSFRMEKGITYVIDSSVTVWLKKVIFYQPSESLTLEETASNSTNHNAVETAHNANEFVLSVKRSWTGNQWGTMCLPINISNADLVKQFHTDKVYELNTANTTANTITFTEKSSYTACTPCLIRPTAQVQNPSFADPNNKITYIASNLTATAANGISFTGVLGSENIYLGPSESNINLFVGNENKLFYPSSSAAGTIKGFRAYFTMARPSDLQEVKGLTLVFEDDATGIIRVETDPFEENANVYTIDGRNMGNAKNLSRGLYIQNGRKFFVK